MLLIYVKRPRPLDGIIKKQKWNYADVSRQSCAFRGSSPTVAD